MTKQRFSKFMIRVMVDTFTADIKQMRKRLAEIELKLQLIEKQFKLEKIKPYTRKSGD